MNQNKPLSIEDAHRIIKNQSLRIEIARQCHHWFFQIYFSHYIKYKTADFHREIFAYSQDESIQNLVIIAFRGSGKSTIMNLSYPIWAITGIQQKKFILIVGKTQQQARQHLKNLKNELEQNKLLKADLGPFEEEDDEWRSYSLVMPKYNARITAISTDQSIRGIRHNEHRPDLIICDDIEDLSSVKTKESRDKTYEWLTSETIAAGDRPTRLILIGNLLHEDSVIMRFKDKITNKEINGIFREYPLVSDDGMCLWEGKYPTQKDIKDEQLRIGNKIAWQREFLLNIVHNYERIIQKDWIQYYDEIPLESAEDYEFTVISVDPAISQKNSADYTAMVFAKIFGRGKKRKIFILPNPVCKRLTFFQTIEQVKQSAGVLKGQNKVRVYVEDVGYQKALIDALKKENINVSEFKVNGMDKYSRLQSASFFVQSKQVFFPRKGAEKLINQIVNFGLEKHDDLADAFSMLLLKSKDEHQRCLMPVFFGYERRDPMLQYNIGDIVNQQF